MTVPNATCCSLFQEEPLPHELRPVPVLKMTMDYLATTIMDEVEGREGEWFDFVWNRTRGIRKVKKMFVKNSKLLFVTFTSAAVSSFICQSNLSVLLVFTTVKKPEAFILSCALDSPCAYYVLTILQNMYACKTNKSKKNQQFPKVIILPMPNDVNVW